MTDEASSDFEFTDSERAWHKDMRAIATDARGTETLVGLTLEETAFYMGHQRGVLKPRRDSESRDRFIELHNKHEAARLAVIGNEAFLRSQNPTRH